MIIVDHPFNPARTIADFPTKVDAILPDKRVTLKYQITNKGELFRLDTGYKKKMTIIDDSWAYSFNYAKDGKSVHTSCRVDEIMALSFYKDMYEEDDVLQEVVHDDRDPFQLHIHTLVPNFSLPQMQAYFIYRLPLIDQENYRVALSKYPKQFSLEYYLVGDKGSVFSLRTLRWLIPEFGRYPRYKFTPTFTADHKGSCATKTILGHTVVAASFLEGMTEEMDVHHRDRHPWNNNVSNLQILSREDHMELHRGLPYNDDYEDTLASLVENTCADCLQQRSNLTECSCRRFYCQAHLMQHQPSCWYYLNRNNEVYTAFVTLVTENGPEPEYEINRQSQIRGKKTKVMVKEEFRVGYITVRIGNKAAKTFKTHRVNRLMGFTFKAGSFPGADSQVDHKDSNRRLNHINNIRWLTRRENVIEACGVNVVVESKATQQRVFFRSLRECADVYGCVYTNLYNQLASVDKVLDLENHIFFRAPKNYLRLGTKFHNKTE